MRLNERVAAVDLSLFSVDQVTETADFLYLKSHVYCPVYFAFYANFIVCTGDYGEWVFDCTWQTLKRPLPANSEYLFGKLSRDCNKQHYSYDKIVADFPSLKSEFLVSHAVDDISYDKETLQQAEELFQDFYEALLESDSYRFCSVVDNYSQRICDALELECDTEEWIGFYEIGDAIPEQLVVVLAMLQKLREDGIIKGE